MGNVTDRRARARWLHHRLQRWIKFVTKCITRRPDTESFRRHAQFLMTQCPLPPMIVAQLFLRPQPDDHVSLKPHMPPYVRVLAQSGYTDAPSILGALYKFSSLHLQLDPPHQGEDDDGARLQGAEKRNKRGQCWDISSWFEEFMFYQVIKTMVDGTAFRDKKTILGLCQVISLWMKLFTAAASMYATDVLGQLQDTSKREAMETSRAAFFPLLLRLVESPLLVRAISAKYAKGIRKDFSNSLGNFIQTLQPAPFVDRLHIFYTDTLAKLDPVDKKQQAAANAAMDEILETTVGSGDFVIPDLPVPSTRAALYVFLNASLIGRPMIDDAVLISYIHKRYPGQTQSGVIDLILASFDIVSNAVFRNEAPKDAHLLKSFLINKLPLLLSQLCAAGLDVSTSEFCITEALNQVDTGIFPTTSLMFDESRSSNPYTESVREEFCTACALHGLVDREHLERILGEMSMSYEPSLEKLSKEKLVQECLSNPSKLQGLIGDLDKMDGNVGAVAQSLVDVMRRLCHTKETVSLKMVCSQLAQKPQTLDVLLLFEKLPIIVEPLCQVLDNWHYDDDQNEYQPVYEEFGSILLLVLAFAYRYNLNSFDLGIISPDSSVAKILNRAHVSRDKDELSEQERGHVSGWILGLFANDSGGLGDDLMSSCPPQEFYLLVATIFQNIIVGYTCGYLSDDALKGGVEYLVDTFLLPSLVPALSFLAEYLWVEQVEQKAVIKVLQLILLPSSISGEASTMLSSVRNLVAKPLEHSLRTYQRQDPKNQDIEPLLIALKDNLPLSRRTGGADHVELESWAASSSAGLSGALRHTVQGLVSWAMNPTINGMPTSYTHRQLIAFVRVAGANRALRFLLEEIRTQTEAGSPSIVYDVVGAMICAPNVTNEAPPTDGMMDATGLVVPTLQRRSTLRQALASVAERARRIQKDDPLLAEMAVRLHRRVEAHMELPQPQTILGDAESIPLNLAAAGAGLGDVDAMGVAGVGGDVSLDLGLGGPGSAGGLDTTSDGDLFGGLDTSMDMFGWDSMDLTGN